MTRRWFSIPGPWTFVCLAFLAGCARTSPPVVFHTLSPVSVEGSRPALRSPLVLEVMPVEIPELLQRSQIVLLEEPNVHRLSATHRWGNPLEKDMQRVLAENLAALLGHDVVVPYPLGARLKAARKLFLDVQRCDGAPGGTLRFRATWRLIHEGRVVLSRQFAVEAPVPGTRMEDLAAAHGRALGDLALDIVKALEALPQAQ